MPFDIMPLNRLIPDYSLEIRERLIAFGGMRQIKKLFFEKAKAGERKSKANKRTFD